MISRIVVRNFRSLRDTTLELRNRNVLIGANKSGKSNVLDALSVLVQNIGVADVAKPINDRGGFANIIWKGEGTASHPLNQLAAPRPIEFQLDGYLNVKDRSVRFSYQIAIAGDLQGQIAIKHETLDMVVDDSKRRLIEISDGRGSARRLDGSEVFSNPGDPKKPALAYDVPGWEAGALRQEVMLWQFYDLIPLTAQRTVNPAVAVSFMDPNGANLSSWLHTIRVNHSTDFERISKVVREAFPEIESLGTIVTQAGTTFLTTREKHLQSPLTILDASAGQLKFIALVSLIYSPFAVPLIMLEEPENHLHPRLLELLVDIANQRAAETKGQVAQSIITTHSPYLVDLLEPEDIVLVSKRDGATEVHRPTSGDELRRLMRESESTLGRLWFSGSLGNV